MKHRIIFFGPPSVGKGRTAGLVKETPGVSVHIVETGEIARQKRRSDPEFERLYGPVMDNGDYLPDAVACDLIAEATHPIRHFPGITLFDGHGRTGAQIDWSAEQNLMGNGSMLIAFTAPLEVCLERLRDREERFHKKRSDGAHLKKRYELFVAHYNEVEDKAYKAGARVFSIDASRSIENVVLPKVLNLIQRLQANFSPAAEQASLHPFPVPHALSPA